MTMTRLQRDFCRYRMEAAVDAFCDFLVCISSTVPDVRVRGNDEEQRKFWMDWACAQHQGALNTLEDCFSDYEDFL